jgi:hypothetical protein
MVVLKFNEKVEPLTLNKMLKDGLTVNDLTGDQKQELKVNEWDTPRMEDVIDLLGGYKELTADELLSILNLGLNHHLSSVLAHAKLERSRRIKGDKPKLPRLKGYA